MQQWATSDKEEPCSCSYIIVENVHSDHNSPSNDSTLHYIVSSVFLCQLEPVQFAQITGSVTRFMTLIFLYMFVIIITQRFLKPWARGNHFQWNFWQKLSYFGRFINASVTLLLILRHRSTNELTSEYWNKCMDATKYEQWNSWKAPWKFFHQSREAIFRNN